MSSSKYEPGTVAVATVRGAEGVRVMRTSNGDWRCAVPDDGGRIIQDDPYVTDIRQLVVLDIAHERLSLIRDLIECARGGDVMVAVGSDLDELADLLVDQIEAQTKPPRIPEPGLWGVVEAHPGSRTVWPVEFVRDSMHEDAAWRSLADGSAWEWDSLVDPVLVRDGIEDGAE